MTTHELAKLLLSVEDKPVYIQEHYECQGEWGTGYSVITGLNDTRVEGGYIFEINYLSAQPNDRVYDVGDCLAYIEGSDSSVELSRSDVLFMIYCREYSYNDGIENNVTFFYKNDDWNKPLLLTSNVSVCVTSGFHPERINMTLNEAKVWFEQYFTDEVSEYK